MPNRHGREAEARVVEMYEAGELTTKIVDDTGVPRASVYAILKRHQVAPNRAARLIPVVTTEAELTVEERLAKWQRIAAAHQEELGRHRMLLESARTLWADYFAGRISVEEAETIAAHLSNVMDSYDWDT